MKIWITRGSTGSIHAGGLERLRVWFQPPLWQKAYTLEELNDIPWELNEMQGVGESMFHHWIGGNDHHYPSDCISFGKMFGYGSKWNDMHRGHVDGLAEYVWEKLKEHYGGTKFPHGWYEYENAGKCHQSGFVLKIDLEITFKTNQQ